VDWLKKIIACQFVSDDCLHRCAARSFNIWFHFTTLCWCCARKSFYVGANSGDAPVRSDFHRAGENSRITIVLIDIFLDLMTDINCILQDWFINDHRQEFKRQVWRAGDLADCNWSDYQYKLIGYYIINCCTMIL
jgi:hypothetical protein